MKVVTLYVVGVISGCVIWYIFGTQITTTVFGSKHNIYDDSTKCVLDCLNQGDGDE